MVFFPFYIFFFRVVVVFYDLNFVVSVSYSDFFFCVACTCGRSIRAARRYLRRSPRASKADKVASFKCGPEGNQVSDPFASVSDSTRSMGFLRHVRLRRPRTVHLQLSPSSPSTSSIEVFGCVFYLGRFVLRLQRHQFHRAGFAASPPRAM